MTLKQLARHRGLAEAATAQRPVQRSAGRPQHRAGAVPQALLTGVLALAVLLALVVVILGVAGR